MNFSECVGLYIHTYTNQLSKRVCEKESKNTAHDLIVYFSAYVYTDKKKRNYVSDNLRRREGAVGGGGGIGCARA